MKAHDRLISQKSLADFMKRNENQNENDIQAQTS